ncbi:division/cell wall cluster transcriptional repressor MraZ [Treponema sp. TIM-1]|uniref:division/cell wall cluster transcriptional repressor MraZ n=1 Tax=Treponema sp. TIM-1 TaxID=2898417 RepID=UPI003980E442
MDLLIGEFNNTLDDKGRVSLPSRFRSILPGNRVFLTQGGEDCIWVCPPEFWEDLLQKVLNSTSIFKASSRVVRRRIIGPAQEVEIDKAGRIAIPQSLRDFAGLSKDCVILGQLDYMEIWNIDRYRNYRGSTETEFRMSFEELGSNVGEAEHASPGGLDPEEGKE